MPAREKNNKGMKKNTERQTYCYGGIGGEKKQNTSRGDTMGPHKNFILNEGEGGKRCRFFTHFF